MISAKEALLRLKEGNLRFRTDDIPKIHMNAEARSQLAKAQSPFAIILGCSDARVPAEIIFGQGLGDLFVIRVAGNIVAPSQIASIEFAAENFGTPLVVVLGHSRCGAVEATIQQLKKPTASRSPHLYSIVDRIRPAVEFLVDSENSDDMVSLMQRAVRANIKTSVANLRHGSAILETLIESKRITIVGAEYSLETGNVEFFEN